MRPAPSGQPPTALHLGGTATWYRYVAGQAAAGPRLRAALGAGWRGRTVAVCAVGIGRRCVVVRLTDWCACGGNRIVDLDRRDFARLASPSLGVLAVTVTPVGAPPDTSTEEKP
jgi:hypothetical protein